MTKMTQKGAILYAIDNLTDAPADVIEKLQSIVASLDKKAGAERKPTAVQVQNEVYKAEIMRYYAECAKPMTVTEAIATVPALAGFSTPKVSALLNQLVDAGQLEKGKNGRSTVFFPVK